MAERKTREQMERDEYARTAEWADPNSLLIPKALLKRWKEEGLAHRWLRVHIRGDEKENAPSLIMRQREGWKLVTIEECPEWIDAPEGATSTQKGLIVVGDLALAVMPVERANARRRYVDKQTHDMGMGAIKQQLRKFNTKEMPIFDDSSQMVTKGSKATDFAE